MNHSEQTVKMTVDEMTDASHWERLWAERWDARERLYVGEAHLGYWQARAEDFSDGRRACDYDFGRKIVDALSPYLPEKAEVLDVGCGPGSLLIPLSQAGHHVTAVEPAQRMIDELQANAAAAGIGAYEVISRVWQEVDVEGLAGRFDLALSSITMWMFRDLRTQLERLEQVSRGLCCVVGGASRETSGHSDGLWSAIMGDIPQPGYSEFPLAFNLLYAMGRLPEVRIVDYRTERSVESKTRQQKLFYTKYAKLTPKVEKLIEEKVKTSSESGMVQESCKASVVFWQSPAGNDASVE
ncbi:SAM-dependent methyltransferase [Oceanidesulfovibrio indonesiensis]|jgi:SAM-dependent methyltransferase|uniref:SAM-dependent methyltransferase n=1 Tax=Oceanidesulfovibrio indonesiensis TaxID=54767 RepID=A0A7M3MA72_9BACT|nr:class I SAM-dependent methyltransferase [Oceanidesulfovibrio indonesiensis]TVM14494.1 SAM-dependent methyltransferase [Oceanidesulfovibrio indonesiensis]